MNSLDQIAEGNAAAHIRWPHDTPGANLRFWVWIHDGPVKLTLRPGQTLGHHRHSRTEEGWESETNIWENDGGRLLLESITDGRDCDGRLTRHWAGSATALAGNPDAGGATHEGKPIAYPTWEKLAASQRDEYAEAAGY